MNLKNSNNLNQNKDNEGNNLNQNKRKRDENDIKSEKIRKF
jgi:hypothetical protein